MLANRNALFLSTTFLSTNLDKLQHCNYANTWNMLTCSATMNSERRYQETLDGLLHY